MSDSLPKVLHVDDNPSVRSFVEPGLRDAGFDYVSAEDGWAGLEMLKSTHPDVVVLDIILGDPNFNGLDVCKRIRESGSDVPVIFLTVKDRTEDPWFMDRAFSLGGDDYVAKREELQRIEQQMGLIPTEVIDRKSDLDELIARIRARLPRTSGSQVYNDHLRVDLSNEQVEVELDGEWENASLTATEFSVLRKLVENAGKPVAKSALVAAAGIDPVEVDVDRALQTHIYRLRKAIEIDSSDPQFIVTYHRVGYKFETGAQSDSQ
jgi:two-component system, OmpR family, response regulator